MRLTAIIVTAILCGCSPTRFVSPPFLVEGDRIGIVSVSSRVNLDYDTAKVRKIVKMSGFDLVFGDKLLDQSDSSFGRKVRIKVTHKEAKIEYMPMKNKK